MEAVRRRPSRQLSLSLSLSLSTLTGLRDMTSWDNNALLAFLAFDGADRTGVAEGLIRVISPMSWPVLFYNQPPAVPIISEDPETDNNKSPLSIANDAPRTVEDDRGRYMNLLRTPPLKTAVLDPCLSEVRP